MSSYYAAGTDSADYTRFQIIQNLMFPGWLLSIWQDHFVLFSLLPISCLFSAIVQPIWIICRFTLFRAGWGSGILKIFNIFNKLIMDIHQAFEIFHSPNSQLHSCIFIHDKSCVWMLLKSWHCTHVIYTFFYSLPQSMRLLYTADQNKNLIK